MKNDFYIHMYNMPANNRGLILLVKEMGNSDKHL